MLRPNFDDGVKVVRLNAGETALADGKFPASGSFIDVADFERAVFLVSLGALDTAVVFKVQQAAAVDGTPKDITGATKTIGTTDDNKWFTIEVETRKLDINNGYHYLTLDIGSAAGSNDYAAMFCLLYGAGEAPVTQLAGYYDAIVVAG